MSLRPLQRGFTLVELLVVIGIIAILVALVTIAAGAMMGRAKSTKDSGNHRTIGASTWSFALDNTGKLLHPRTEPSAAPDEPSTSSQLERFWVNAYGDDADGNARIVQVGGIDVELRTALEEGAAFPYIGDVKVYQSPLDPTIGNVEEFVFGGSNLTKRRIRSYSLNGFVGVEWGADDWTRLTGGAFDFPDQYWRPTETASQIPQPSSTMCSIGEQDLYGRNLNGWLLHPDREQWLDFPAFWNEGSANLSFIDGSTGSITLKSEGLKEKWEEFGHNVFYSDAKDEYKQFRKVLLPGVIGTVLD